MSVTVILVDSQETSRERLAFLLERAGATVVAAFDVDADAVGVMDRLRLGVRRPEVAAATVAGPALPAVTPEKSDAPFVATTPAVDAAGPPSILSPRESEILELLSHGLTGESIARELVLSAETIKTHIRNAMLKLEASTRVHAIAIAIRSGYIGDLSRRAMLQASTDGQFSARTGTARPTLAA